ncbi:hypothetical protein HMJ29_11735 [Hymenobacter taeanensis]|uniref:Uncharacterized protein n=1 Tax=Hymenobacter taeanensis TaxID=2735321 RepID=A0A6M6BIF5_9BACT|nr:MULTISPECIES: hypothetical protein [Hymenobacter]QJX47574.1 hypothetical protein HMJ29_11735 [Hymenobacter taeanensis]UOQ82943.1 hypothetical protein MUN83_09350 [Hymenobacter sp. 5414T-23]
MSIWHENYEQLVFSSDEVAGYCFTLVFSTQLICFIMTICLTRDSVANGDDDNAPHICRFIVPDNTSLAEILRLIPTQAYLATIGGGKATWSVVSGRPVAVVAQQWSETKLLSWQTSRLTSLNVTDNTLYLHFNYHAQIEPEIVYQVLSRLKLTSSR